MQLGEVGLPFIPATLLCRYFGSVSGFAVRKKCLNVMVVPAGGAAVAHGALRAFFHIAGIAR
jgi:hypothetical protein